MTSLRPFRSFFIIGILVLLITVLSIEVLAWVAAYEIKSMIMDRSGGIFLYSGLLIKSLILPEVTTVFVLSGFMHLVHGRLKLNLASTTELSGARYLLSFLPIMVLTCLFFYPFPQAVRYVLAKFPPHSLGDYWTNYLITTYSWTRHLGYLFLVLYIGYSTLIISLKMNIISHKKSPAAS
jgi:hypothetical protein